MHRLVRRNRYQRRAAVVVQVAVCSTVVLGMGALAIDVGAMYTAQTELQISADAAALAGAAELVGEGDVCASALAAADYYASLNKVMGMTPAVYQEDVEFGRAVPDPYSERFLFESADQDWDAIRVTLCHLHSDDPELRPAVEIPLTFAQVFGMSSTELQAKATAVLVPRDIAVVIDLSGSMCWDSQLRYWNRNDGGYSNLRDVWCARDGPEPDRPYVPGSELEGQYADDSGPDIGAMTEWGTPLIPGDYNPTTDPGLYYLPKAQNWSGDSSVEQLVSGQGYNDFETWAVVTNETSGYLTPPVTDASGFTSQVVWEEDVGDGHDRVTIYMTSDGEGPALSHLAVLLPPCAWNVALATAASQDNYPTLLVNPDPRTGLSGLKFDDTDLGEGDVVETEWFSFEVPSGCNIVGLDLATKSGGDVALSQQAFQSAEPWNSERWRNRVAVALGLAQWDSGMDGSGGNGDGRVDSNELTWIAKYNPCWNWSWTNYIDWAQSSSAYSGSNYGFRNRYGLKTFIDFLMAQKPESYATCDLWTTPEQPLRAVKDAVNIMIQEIAQLDSLDQASLQIFARTTRLEVDLTEDLPAVSDRLYQMQSGHYDRYTNIGGGLAEAIDTFERPGSLARASAHKVIMLMSDGKANIDAGGNYVGDGAWAACEHARQQAQYAASQGYRIYTVSVGYYVDRELMGQIASIGSGEEFYAVGDPSTYSEQLRDIFQTLGGKRPVALID